VPFRFLTRRSVVVITSIYLIVSFVLVVCGVSLLAIGPAEGHTGVRAAPRPNFVFVLTDDLTLNLLSHMPHVQALEDAGLTMSRYYVVDSLCCPSRASIFTGEYPHDDGVFKNQGPDGGYKAYNKQGDPRRSFAVALHNAGYRTAMMGKYLNGYQPQDPVAQGWDQWDVAGEAYWEVNYTLNENGSQKKYGHNPDDYLTDVLSGKAKSFIASSARQRKPFMLEVSTFAPHKPYAPPPRYQNAARHVAYPKTAAYNRSPKNPPSWLRGHRSLTAAQQRAITVSYRKRVEAAMGVDDMVGRLRAQLLASGELRNTYIIFSSDNGYHMGEYRLMPGKMTAFDTDIHVPLIVTGPGVPAGKVSSQLASNIDLSPTFETLAGLNVPDWVDGRSLADVWHGQHPGDWRQAILIEHHGPNDSAGDPDQQGTVTGNPPSYEAVRTANALYVQYANGQQEYYNTVRDALELDNNAAQGVPAALSKALTALEHCHTGRTCWAAAHLPP
jgi:N-acetylglucosamine-6-sulfatase